MTREQERVGYAAMWSAALVSLICAVGYATVDLQHHSDLASHAGVISFATLVFFVIGWPIALVGAVVLAVLFAKSISRRSRLACVATVICAIAFGAFGVPIVWLHFMDSRGLTTMTVSGALAGLASGVCFCWLVASVEHTDVA